MTNYLSLWRFQQYPVAREATSHWAIIYEEPDPLDDTEPTEKIKTCFHISRNTEGQIARFEQCSVNEDRWHDKIIDMRNIGYIQLSRYDFERVCRKVTKEFIFRKTKNNCQNWCEMVLQEVGMESPVIPSNKECCGCLYLINISSSGGSILNDKPQS